MTGSTRIALAVASLAVFAVSLDATVLFVAFPAIRADFDDVSLPVLSWVLNAYTVVFGALLVPAGRLADQLGRRRVFVTGLVLFSVASLGCACAPSAWWLIVDRALQGVGAEMLFPASLALVLAEALPEERSLAAGLWGAVGALAAAVGPSLGAVTVSELGWRAVFAANLPVGVAAVLLARRRLREPRDVEATPAPSATSTLLLVVGTSALGHRRCDGRPRRGRGRLALGPLHSAGAACGDALLRPRALQFRW